MWYDSGMQVKSFFISSYDIYSFSAALKKQTSDAKHVLASWLHLGEGEHYTVNLWLICWVFMALVQHFLTMLLETPSTEYLSVFSVYASKVFHHAQGRVNLVSNKALNKITTELKLLLSSDSSDCSWSMWAWILDVFPIFVYYILSIIYYFLYLA